LDYLDWQDHDFIFASLPGARLFDTGPDTKSWILLLTGVRATVNTASVVDTTGVVFMADYDGVETRRYGQFGLVPDFFRMAHPDGLDDTLVSLPIAEVDERLAEAMGGENFSLVGWDDRVEAPDGFTAAAGFFKSLRQGLTVATSLENVAPDLRTVTNARGDETTLVQVAPGGDGQRLIELPTVVDSNGVPLEDGTNLQPFVIGNVGDGQPDVLSLQLSVDGVDPEELASFTARYRFASEDLPGEYGLTGATQDGAYRYRVDHEVQVGFDVETGANIPLEVVLDLPEGGTSRFRVDVDIPRTGSDPGFDECRDYIPTPAGGSSSGLWQMPDDLGSAVFTASGDPGGGYMTITASSGDADLIIPRLVVRSPSDTGAIFSASSLGTDTRDSVATSFEVPPGGGYIAEAIQNNSANADDYPVNWTLTMTFKSVVDCYEPNQSSTQAKRLPLNINGVTAFMLGGYRSNGLDSKDYDDWYKLIISEPSRLTIDLSQSPNDIRMRLRLWGLNDRQLAIAGGSAPGDLATLTYDAQPGTYFLSAEAAALGNGVINTATQALPDHFATPYRLDVRTEPLP
jgi:hypothetical protein